MCGIIAVVRRPFTRATSKPQQVLERLDAGLAALSAPATDLAAHADVLDRAAASIEEADRLLRGTPGVTCLLHHRALSVSANAILDSVGAEVLAFEQALDEGGAAIDLGRLERVNSALIRVKDAVWAVQRDRLPTAEKVRALAGPDAGPAAIEAFTSVQQALSALDRLEVRGRDSAGLHLLVSGHGLDLTAPANAGWPRSCARTS